MTKVRAASGKDVRIFMVSRHNVFVTETNGVLCEVGADAEEGAGDFSTITEHGRL
jgi:hypothetical protein